MPTSTPHFTPAFFQFLRQLARNNSREWFQANKAAYEEHVKAPALRFVAELKPRMAKVSPRIDVDPKPVGGSMSRLNRDTRFSKDKSPYKTNVGLMFTHDGCGDLMLGYHLSLAPGDIRAYAGIWEPDGPMLEAIRSRMLSHADEWKKAAGPAFRARFTFDGESLKRPPKVKDKPIDPDHPLIEDLKRKSHAAYATFDEKSVCAPGFIDEYVAAAKAAAPLMAFVCKAAGVWF